MSAYGSGTGPEYLDEPEYMDDPLFEGEIRVWLYTVTTDAGTTGHASYEEASRHADACAAQGIAVALTVAGEALWSFDPGREEGR